MKKIYLNTLTPEEIIKRLKNGEIIKIDGSDYNHCKMIDGIICYIATNYTYINHTIDTGDDDYYIEEQEEFKIENTGFYKTRDGRLVWVSYAGDKYIAGIIDGDDVATRWKTDGTFCGDNRVDLVEYVGD